MMKWIDNANNVEWFSHKTNNIDTNIQQFVPGSGGTFMYYNHNDEAIFCSIDKKSDFIIDITVEKYIMDSNGVYCGIQFPPEDITLEQINNPTPSKKLKIYFRKKKLKRII